MASYPPLATGGRPLIIPLFIPHLGCPHRCVFCDQRAITGASGRLPSADQIRNEINRYLTFSRKNHSTTQISFFGGNFLGLKEKDMLRLLECVTTFVDQGAVDSLRFSTRPDTITPERLAALSPFPVETVELGVQSMNNNVLEACQRGHTADSTIAAAQSIKDAGYRLGLQMMVGLPEDTDDGAMDTARRLVDLAPDFVRIYPTLVLNGSPLAKMFRDGHYTPMILEKCVSLVAKLFRLFTQQDISVVRMGLQASDGLANPDTILAGPYHPAFGHLVHGKIVLDAIEDALKNMKAIPRKLTIGVHPTMVSRVQGLNKVNIKHIRRQFGLHAVSIFQDDSLASNRLMLGDQEISL